MEQRQTTGLSLNPGRQTQAYKSPADIVIYGGAAGGGKSHWLLLEAARYFDTLGWVAKLFRRTYAQVSGGGGLWAKTHQIYRALDGKPNNSDLFWTFPSTAHVGFGHLQHENDMYSHQGKEYGLIGFDELDHFLETQFWYLFSRNRTTCGRRAVMRATINPNPEHFAKQLILWWLDKNGQFPDLDKAGVLRWFVRSLEDGDVLWHDTNAEEFWKTVQFYRKEIDPDFKPTSLTFIPASVDDNPHMPKSYKAKLMALPYIERQRLLYGDWKIKPAAGTMFKEQWFQLVQRIPPLTALVRYWDRAGTSDKPIPGKKRSKDPDYTAGVLMGQTESGQWIVLDLVHFRGSTLEVEQKIFQTAVSDREQWGHVLVGIEQDPGSAGKFEAETYARKLAGFDVKIFPARQDKITRARPFSAQVEAGNVMVYQAPWNERFFRELEGFPDAAHDDIVDGCSGAFNAFGEINIMTQASFWEQLGDVI